MRNSAKLAKAKKSQVVRWFNATHAILLAVNNKNVLTYGGLMPVKNARQLERESLDEWWGITDKATLLDMIEWLMRDGHRRGQVVDIGAWDYLRAMSLLASGYLIGYISRSEALDRSLEIAKLIQREYNSWDEFTEVYLKGYKICSKQSDKERREIYNRLKNNANSIYSMPWNLELKKEW